MGEEPHSLKSNEMAECAFQPQQPLVCDTFKNCEGLSRVAFMDGNGVVMLGKVISCERRKRLVQEARRSESATYKHILKCSVCTVQVCSVCSFSWYGLSSCY